MPQVPRIQRTIPNGPVTTAPYPVPVVGTIRWHDGAVTEVPALAVAWTRDAVEVRWTDPWGAEHTDWIEAVDVRRRPADPDDPDATPGGGGGPDPGRLPGRTPRSSGRRPRW